MTCCTCLEVRNKQRVASFATTADPRPAKVKAATMATAVERAEVIFANSVFMVSCLQCLRFSDDLDMESDPEPRLTAKLHIR